MTQLEKREEYSILGSQVRVAGNSEQSEQARAAIELYNQELEALKGSAHQRSNLDIAVLAGLNLANRLISIQKEYKTNLEAYRVGIDETLSFIDEVTHEES